MRIILTYEILFTETKQINVNLFTFEIVDLKHNQAVIDCWGSCELYDKDGDKGWGYSYGGGGV